MEIQNLPFLMMMCQISNIIPLVNTPSWTLAESEVRMRTTHFEVLTDARRFWVSTPPHMHRNPFLVMWRVPWSEEEIAGGHQLCQFSQVQST
jgi:hypothetical protein